MSSDPKTHQRPSIDHTQAPSIPGTNKVGVLISVFLWLLFAGNIIYLIAYDMKIPDYTFGTLYRVNGFTILIWSTVTFFSAIVSTYATRYLIGFGHHTAFMIQAMGFTLAVMLLVASNHIFMVLISWYLMGFLMSSLIGIDTRWGEAREAAKFTRVNFLVGSIFLSIGLLIMSFASGEFTVPGVLASVSTLPIYITTIAALFMIVAAAIQSAMFPFQKWLLSAMTSPTPASALMHAGFVNGAAIMLTIFATIFIATKTLTFLFVIGGITAIAGQFMKLLQVNVKHKLACSTIAQMGFMIMQCGLGFFNAAIAHLILHGFYKAYLFLSSGEEIKQLRPENPHIYTIKPLQLVPVLIFGAAGAYLFAALTGKGIKLDSGLFLTLIVAITVGQATYNIVKERSLSYFQKVIFPPIIFLLGIGTYAWMYNGVTLLMEGMPMVALHMPLNGVQVSFGSMFLLGFFIMKLDLYKKIPWLYVKLLNLSQPSRKSVLNYKSK